MKSIKKKILSSFAVIIILSIVLGLVSIGNARNSLQHSNDILNKELQLLIEDNKLSFNMSQRIALSRGYVLFGSASYKNDFHAYSEQSEKIHKEILRLSDSEQIKDVIERSDSWRKVIEERLFPAYDEGKKDEAMRILRDEATPVARGIMNELQEMSNQQEAIITASGEEIIRNGETSVTISILITIIIVLIGGVLAVILARKISKPIVQIKDRMATVANGELNHEFIRVNTKDEISELMESTNKMQSSLRGLIQNVSSAAELVSSRSEELTQLAYEVEQGSGQVAATISELSKGAEVQAGNAVHVANMIDEYVRKISIANQKGCEISETSHQVLSLTDNGIGLMRKSVEQMNAIDSIFKDSVKKVKDLEAQSQKVSTLVQVIKDISEQTNLLALNAAIEAARAGELGKGFAVVAKEVKKLAEQVSHSVVDITDIVENIQNESKAVVAALEHGYMQVDEGTKQISITGRTFETITLSVSKMDQKIHTITADLEHITNNSKKINSAIEDIASVSEESVASIEEILASSQQTNSSMVEIANNSAELAELAEELTRKAALFKL